MRIQRKCFFKKTMALLLSAVLAAGTLQVSAPAYVRAEEAGTANTTLKVTVRVHGYDPGRWKGIDVRDNSKIKKVSEAFTEKTGDGYTDFEYTFGLNASAFENVGIVSAEDNEREIYRQAVTPGLDNSWDTIEVWPVRFMDGETVLNFIYHRSNLWKPETVPEKSGYTLAGWQTSGGEPAFVNDHGSEAPQDIKEATDFYAVWTENPPEDTNLASGEDWVLDRDGRLTISSDAGMADWCQNGGKVHGQVQAMEIKDSVTGILSGAFFQCESLASVTISEDVTRVEEQAFENCYSLERITLPKKVQSIGRAAFSECVKLTDITIPASVTHIGASAFYGCRDLSEVTLLGTEPPALDMDVFAGCGAVAADVEGIRVPAGYEDAYKEDSAWVNWALHIAGGAAEDTNIASGEGWVLDRDGKLTIESDKGMDNWTKWLGNSGSGVFNEQVKSADILSGVKYIKQNAFLRCRALKSITLPDGLERIEASAFQDCHALTGITLPDSVTSIGSMAFSICTDLEHINIPYGVQKIGSTTFQQCGKLKHIEIPESVTSIGDCAFLSCRELTSITLPENVTSIDASAFQGCSKLTDVTMLGKKPPTLGANVFDDCKFVGDNAKGIRVPEGSADEHKKEWTGWAEYIADDAMTLAKQAVQLALDGIKATNDVDEGTLRSAVTAKLEGADILYPRSATILDFAKTNATEEAEGRIRATVKITLFNYDASRLAEDKVVFDRTIDKLKYYTVEVSAGEGGSAGIGFGSTDVSVRELEGTEINVWAVADKGYTFAGWMEDGVLVSSDRQYAFTLEKNRSLTAEFEKKPPVHIHEYGEEWSSDESGHWHECSCGARSEEAAHMDDGGSVTQYPTETDTGIKTYYCKICGRELRTEVLDRLEFFTVEVSTNGGGDVHIFANAVHFSSTRQLKGTSITARAHAEQGYVFAGWMENGSLASSESYYDFILESDRSLVAVFEKDTQGGDEPGDNDNPGSDPDAGKLEAGVETDGKAPGAQLAASAAELADCVLTPEEKQQWKDGADVRIVLDIKDGADSIAGGDKALVEEKLAQAGEVSGYKVGQYLDVSLFKVIDGSSSAITKTSSKLKITIAVPDSLKGGAQPADFAVIRVHEGVAEVLGDLDNSPETITIETDSFSAYAIVYSSSDDSGDDNNGDDDNSGDDSSGDEDISGGADDSSGDEDSNGGTNDSNGTGSNGGAAASGDSSAGTPAGGGAKPVPSKDQEPKTGTGAPLGLYATLAMIAGFTYLLLYFKDSGRGMTEEAKKELVEGLVRWAKKGGRLRRLAALGAIFLLLAYYHSIGKRLCVEWKGLTDAR